MLIAYNILKNNLFLQKVPITGVIWNKEILLETDRCSSFWKKKGSNIKNDSWWLRPYISWAFIDKQKVILEWPDFLRHAGC
jgi:hypothetical protein